ncbi:hypothetical protein NH340_JMT03057 [Sarcoptes scabiei]|uniref:Minor histocompatibility antigen H13-like protein n=1 Tax=Sarcoptes scabiei TaxID=52283 RepID=A0A132ADG2_SARSC|nr:minor histocompatibility antigen H13-like protein [Sarcoptes scabiei]UXI17114.1 hypothetical protein NH340_JMT03057 [Sarcoptes scabiei]
MSSSEEVIEKIQSAVVDIVNDTIDGTLKPKAKPEGMMVAYGSLVLMALIPIFYGSFKSISYHKEQFVRNILFKNINVLTMEFLSTQQGIW